MFEVYQPKSNKKFRYRLKAANGQIILTGQGYSTKKICLNGVASAKKNSSRQGAFHPKTARDGRKYFTLVAAHGEVIVTVRPTPCRSSCPGGDGCYAASDVPPTIHRQAAPGVGRQV